MLKSPELTDQLARAYREARVLVLGDRTPKLDSAFALHRDFQAIRTSIHRLHSSLSTRDTQLLEKARRATIIALRHHAVLARERWTKDTGYGQDSSGILVNPEVVLQLAGAALALHSDDDPDKPKTSEVAEAVRRTIAEGASIPTISNDWADPPQPHIVDDTSRASKPVVAHPTPAPDSPPTPPILPQPAGSRATSPRRQRRNSARVFGSWISGVLAMLAVGALALFIVTGQQHRSPGSSTSRSVPTPTLTLHAERPLPTPAIRPRVTPSSASIRTVRSAATVPRVVSITVRSQPMGARVTVNGVFRGVTPLRLKRPPGDRLPLLLYKGDLVWQGTVLVKEMAEQRVAVTLTAPPAAQSRASTFTSARPTNSGRYDIALRSGIELYRQGWYGPASGRFKEAAALNPRSADAHLWWARALTNAGRYAEAKRVFEKVVVLAKTGPLAEEAASMLKRL